MVAPGADPANDGEWVSDCEECYVEQKIRDHVVDMEFIATDENGRVLNAVRSDTSEHQKNINKVRAIDIRLTFRSKSKMNQSKATWNRLKEQDVVSVMSQMPKFDPHSNYKLYDGISPTDIKQG